MASITLIFVSLLIIAVPLWLMMEYLIPQAAALLENRDLIINRFEQLKNWMADKPLLNRIDMSSDALFQWVQRAGSYVPVILGSVASMLANIVVAFFVLYFMQINSKRMEKSIGSLFPDARTCTIHSGVEGVAPAMWSVPRPRELEGKTVVLSVGVFYERKGFPLLVEAFARVAPKYPNAVLRIAGDGETRVGVEEAIVRYGLQNRVELLGFQPYERVLQEMVWADVFALIGWDEPFATVFMEAMSAKCPIICANDGGVNDLLRDGIHGRALPPRDKDEAAAALDQLLGNVAERERMGRAAS
ncbi:MAG: glycosyltransferase, partial [Chitinophagaceae bacterium]